MKFAETLLQHRGGGGILGRNSFILGRKVRYTSLQDRNPPPVELCASHRKAKRLIIDLPVVFLSIRGK